MSQLSGRILVWVMLIVGIFLNMVLADADFYGSIEYGIILIFMSAGKLL